MSEVDYIIGIYNQLNPHPENLDSNGVYLLYLLDQKGLLSPQDAIELYYQQFKSERSEKMITKTMIGPFEDLDSLNRFAFLLCEKLNAEKVSLVSVQDYNSFLEANQGGQEFLGDLLEKGNVITNIDHQKKKGLFSRLFKS